MGPGPPFLVTTEDHGNETRSRATDIKTLVKNNRVRFLRYRQGIA